MIKYIAFISLCFLSVLGCFGQKKLVFTDTVHNSKTIIVRENDMVRLLYKGYMGQLQAVYGKVELITDSLIRFEDNWTVRTTDIVGFRRFNKYRELLQGGTQVVTFVGVMFAVVAVGNNPNLNGWQRTGVTFGVGLGASAINNWLFPSRIKHFVHHGWIIEVLPDRQ